MPSRRSDRALETRRPRSGCDTAPSDLSWESLLGFAGRRLGNFNGTPFQHEVDKVQGVIDAEMRENLPLSGFVVTIAFGASSG
jgi:hypothetical protein